MSGPPPQMLIFSVTQGFPLHFTENVVECNYKIRNKQNLKCLRVLIEEVKYHVASQRRQMNTTHFTNLKLDSNYK